MERRRRVAPTASIPDAGIPHEAVPAPPSTAPPSWEEIERRAHQIFEARCRSGRPGDAHGDWLQAERELTAPPRRLPGGPHLGPGPSAGGPSAGGPSVGGG